MSESVRRGDVLLVDLNPTQGQEIRKMRPSLVISSDELNGSLNTFQVASLTTGGCIDSFRVACCFQRKQGDDRVRLVKCLGELQLETLLKVLQVLQEMFAP